MPIMPLYKLDKVPSDIMMRIKKRSELEFNRVTDDVKAIIDDVRVRGDEALKEYSSRFDGIQLDDLKVSEEEFQEAEKDLKAEVKRSIRHATENIIKFHKVQLPPEMRFNKVEKGVLVGKIRIPLTSVGLYIPGGRGCFPSTILMSAIPAKIAEVEKPIICTPPQKNGGVDYASLFAARLVGVGDIYKVGGAQAIAAMAYGTETIPKVDKIIGPGGTWVSSAKRLIQLQGNVAIDFIAGPSEILILADETANPHYVAADVLIEAEHGSDSAGIIVTDSVKLAEEVQILIDQYIQELPDTPVPRRRFAEESLKKFGAIIVTKNIEDAIDFVNEYSVEHLEIMTRDPMLILKRIRNAGSIYLGDYSPSSVGCYACGVNHIIPTGGRAKVYSSLSVFDFLKQPDVSFLTKEGLSTLRNTVTQLSEYEGFYQHGRALEIRFKELGA